MGLFDFFKGKTKGEKEKEELLRDKSLSELKRIASAKNIDTTELDGKEEYVKGILRKGVSKSLIEEQSRIAKRIKGKTEILSPIESNVRKVINKWYPKRGQSHAELKNNLYLLFKKKFGYEYVRKESGEYHADIVIDKRIPVELKVNFGGTSERRRLQQQLEDYKRGYRGSKIFLVICGINKLDDAWGEMKPQLRKDKRVETIIKWE